jgi:hypothetical protein
MGFTPRLLCQWTFPAALILLALLVYSVQLSHDEPILDFISNPGTTPTKDIQSFQTLISSIRNARHQRLKEDKEDKEDKANGKLLHFSVCCITRNENHMKEFLIRNFMAGVEHFYVYDNNHVERGQDRDLRPTLEPFVKAGLVTHIMWPPLNKTSSTGAHSSTGVITETLFSPKEKSKFMDHCLQNFGNSSRWMIRLDTDEHVVVTPSDYTAIGNGGIDHKGNNSLTFGSLPGSELLKSGYSYDDWPLYDYAKKIPSKIGSVLMHWMIMYPNHTILSQPKPLLHAFPNVCIPEHVLTKPLFRPDTALLMHDHWVETLKSGFDQTFACLPGTQPESTNPPLAGAFVVHYYAKSVEEFLVKKEQSLVGYTRALDNMYYKEGETKGAVCDKRPLNYPQSYIDSFDLISEILKPIPNGGVPVNELRGPKPLLYNQHPDYPLYQFLKWTVSERMEWDEESYFALHPNLSDIIEKSKSSQWPYVDALHYFFRAGFWGKNTSCWILPSSSQLCF